jgi:ADP-ribose pyrophosphatase
MEGALPMNKKELFVGRIFSLALEEHLLPDGASATFELIRHSGGAAVLPVLADGRIVLLRQYRPAVDHWLWEVPAGRLAPGEDPASCARRELQEETGLSAGRLHRLGEMLTTPGFCNERVHLFCATELRTGMANPEPDEHLQVVELTVARARAMLADGEIIDGKTQLTLMLYLNSQLQA